MSYLCGLAWACFFLFCLSLDFLAIFLRVETKLFFPHPRLLLLLGSSTTAPLGSNRACLGLCWYRFPTPFPDPPQIATGGRVWFPPLERAHSSPLRGRGWFLLNLGFFGFAGLVHNWVTLAQQGRFCPLLVSVSLPGFQNRTQGHTEPSFVSPLLLPALLFWQGCQISFQLVIHRLLDGANCIEQVAVTHQACLSFYLRGFCVDQSPPFQLPYVFCNRVSAHAWGLANPSDTGPALMGFPVLAEHQISIDRQLAGA